MTASGPDEGDESAEGNGERNSDLSRPQRGRRSIRNLTNWIVAVATVAGVIVSTLPFFLPDAGEKPLASPTAPPATTYEDPPGNGQPVPTSPGSGPVLQPTRQSTPQTGVASSPSGAVPSTPGAAPGSVLVTSTSENSGSEPVRFSGTLIFDSQGFDLDLVEPRYAEGFNVWRIEPLRLYGDAYDMAEWLADPPPTRADCAAHLAKRAGRDASHLVVGSQVCGRTRSNRILRIDVVALDENTITGQVIVWS